MKTTQKLLTFLVASSLLAISPASAQTTLFWDANGDADGTGGTGNWSDSNTWRSGSDTGTPGNWADNSPAYLAGTAGIVTLSTGVSVNGLDFMVGGYTLTGSTLTLAANGIFTNTGTTTISSIIAGSAGLNKTGAGILALNGSAANTLTGGVAVRGGLLWLNYANFNSNELIDNSNSLTLSNGGRLQVLGNSTSAAANLQTFTGTTLNSGYSTIKCDRGGTSATSMTLQLGNITRNAGSVVHFDQNLGTSVSAANIIKTSGVNYNGVNYGTTAGFVGAGFTHFSGTSTRYVRIDANGQFYQAPNNTAWNTGNASSATTLYGITASRDVTSDQTMYALQPNLATNPFSATLKGGNLQLNGMLNINTGTFSILQGEGGGQVRIGSEKDLVLITVSSGGITIDAPIVDYTVDDTIWVSSVTVNNRGSGVTTLSGNNAFTGGLYLTRGRLDLTGTTQATSAITFTSGSNAVLGLDVTKTVTASSAAVNLANGSIRVIGTPTAYSHTLLSAASITGTPVLAEAVTGYSLQVVGGNQLRLVSDAPADPYTAWAGAGVLFDDDANNDGITNGLAFLLGAASPTSADALGLLPKPTASTGALTLTFQMRNAATRGTAKLNLQYSNSLATGSWTTIPVPDTTPDPQASNVSFTITPGAPLNTITATIASSQALNGKLFARTSATEN